MDEEEKHNQGQVVACIGDVWMVIDCVFLDSKRVIKESSGLIEAESFGIEYSSDYCC